MKNIIKLKLIYGGIVLALILPLGACDPVAKTETKISDQEDIAENVEETTQTEVSKKDDSASLTTENLIESKAELPKYLPTDFPLPDDAEIETSHSQQSEGKKSVLLIIHTKEDMETITSMYTTYFEAQKLEDAAQTIDAKNIIIQGESPTNSEYWSMIGGSLASTEGVIELTITWQEL